MSAVEFFDAARSYKRELSGDALTQGDVDALNAVIAGWKPNPSPHALGNAATFYSVVRNVFGSLTQAQVDGFGAILQAMGVARWPLSWAAYGLATAWHETASKMQPVVEAFWLSEQWRKDNLRYYPWHGRGYVQLTWENNYRHADDALSLGGKLLKNPDLALEPDIAASVMTLGMEQGWFCTKKLSDYLPLSGKAGFDAYTQARRIINGTDKAQQIAKEAQAFEGALVAGGWA